MVYGIEPNKYFLKLSKENPRLDSVVIKNSSIYHLPFRNKFDICIANRVVDHIKDIDTAFKEINKALKHRGVFVFVIAHPLKALSKGYRQKIDGYLSEKKDFFSPSSMGVKIPFYYRSISRYAEVASRAGFVIEEIAEPRPVKKAKKLFPKKYDLFSRNPEVLAMRLRKDTR